jgi:hypothetical protein
MPSTIITKNGSGAPLDTDLVAGELAVDLTNGRLYTTDLDSGGTVLELGTNPASDVTFGDNTKAIFGAGSDLQIYHNATSNIVDSSAATLAIQAPQFVVQDDTGAKNIIWVTQPAASVFDVRLSYDGSTKLATTATGIDVTGTVTADGLTVETAAGTSGTIALLRNSSSASNGNAAYLDFKFDNSFSGSNVDVQIGAIKTNAGNEESAFVVKTTEGAGTPTERMRIDSSGNVGIGTSSPSSSGGKLAVKTANAGYVVIEPTSNVTNQIATGIRLHGNANETDRYAGIFCYNEAANNVNSMTFWTSSSGSSAERMRLDASGNLLVGNTGLTSARTSIYNSGVDALRIALSDNAASTTSFIACFSDSTTTAYGTLRFNIVANGNVTNSNNSYGAISDEKLKENITDATPKLDSLNQVRVVNYNLISDPENKQLGVIAQELEQIFPNMVEEFPDKDNNGNDLGTTTKTVKYSVFVPMLIKAMQEQQATIESLTARIAALES